MIFTETKLDLKDINEKKILNNKIKARFDIDIPEEKWKEEALEALGNEGAVFIITDIKGKTIEAYYIFSKEADAFRLKREYTEKLTAHDRPIVEEDIIGCMKSKMMETSYTCNLITVNKTYFHDEIIIRDTVDVFNRANGCRIVRVKPGKLRGYSVKAGMNRDFFDNKTSETLAKGGEVIAVTFKKNIVGAYFFERENDTLRLGESFLINTDIESKARIEGCVRDRIMKIMFYSVFGRKEVINKCYFRDEVIARDYFSPASIWICAAVLIITVDAGLTHIAGFFIALAIILLGLFIGSRCGHRKIAELLNN